jgi:DNA-binding NarL/FixJ family response regulator
VDIENELRRLFRADATGPDATGPDATGPDATGPDATGPDATGPDATGPDALRALEAAWLRADVPGGGERPDPAAAPPIRVLIVDDHELFRRGMEIVLAQENDIDVVGQAADATEAVRLAIEEQPDVVLMDVRIRRSSGIEATRAIKEAVPSARTIMLTMSDDQADLFDAIKAGAAGYLLKEIPPVEVGAAVRAVHDGQSLVSPFMATKLLTEFAALSTPAPQRLPLPVPRLTGREIEILQLVATGLSNRAIGGQLFISENTVKNHVRNILEKLQLHSRMEAVIYAVRQNIIEIT